MADKAAKLAKAAASAARRGPQRVYFPNRIIQFMNTQEKKEELDVVKFRVSPKMNKLEMKEWIETAYDTPVKKVNTANYEGKIVRRSGGKGYYKRPDYKVAFVYLENPWTVPKE
eukprot:Tamp_39341.p1 GENE.Tamp_39341~~Tamp_39341.p1  ORF type:complete len:126 (+),score=40.10 Tamp_39341:37-378(+)